MSTIDLTQLTPKPLTETLLQIQKEATTAGTMTAWERGFLIDVIGRRKRISENQANIIYRIQRNIAKAESFTTVSEEDPNHIKVLKIIDHTDSDFSQWERSFLRDMKDRMIAGRGFSEKQANLIVDMPARLSAQKEAKVRQAANDKIRAAAAAERARLAAMITTEEGFERVAELLKGALESGLKRPAITFALVDADGEKLGNRTVVFKCNARYPDTIKIQSHVKEKRAKQFGIIDTNLGTFTYDGHCPTEVVHFVRHVAEDPEAAAVENGMLTGNCCFCAAGLHDNRSTAVGYGPICAKRYKLPWSQEVYQQRLALRVAKMQAVRSIRDRGTDADETTYTVETVTCGGCSKYVLHPIDFDREERNETNPATWACRNGCGSSSDYFDAKEEKVEARFVISTSDFLKGKYTALTGVTDVYDVKARPLAITGIKPINSGGAEGDGSGFVEIGTKSRTWDCSCGKQYGSSTGRYNHLKKEMIGCHKTN